MDVPSPLEDCYFFYFTKSGCDQTDCSGRHEPASKGIDEECPQWIFNQDCTTLACPLRHMLLTGDFSQQDCKLEEKGGCRRKECPFQHSKTNQIGNSDQDHAPNNHVDSKKTTFKCVPCNLELTNQVHIQTHLSGKKHKLKTNRIETPNAGPQTPNAGPQAPNAGPLMRVPISRPKTVPIRKPKKIVSAQAPDLQTTGPGVVKVGIFWDLENCRLSKSKSLVDFVTKLKNRFGQNGIIDIMTVACNVETNRSVVHLLQNLNVDVIPVVYGRKNLADDLLKRKMRRFAEYPDCRIVLISGDVDFATDILFYKETKGHEVLLLHNAQTSDALKFSATQTFSFFGFVHGLPTVSTPATSQTI